MSASRYLHCLYAEDVRQEQSGQTTIVGVFQGGLKLREMPGALAKFTVLATLYLPGNEVPASVSLEILINGKVINTIEAPINLIATELRGQPGHRQVEGRSLQLVIGFANFPISEPGKIEARATVDGELIKGNPLIVEKENSPSPQVTRGIFPAP